MSSPIDLPITIVSEIIKNNLGISIFLRLLTYLEKKF